MTQDEIITHLQALIKAADKRKLTEANKQFIRDLEHEISEHGLHTSSTISQPFQP